MNKLITHHKPRNGSVTNGEGHDVDYKSSKRQPADVCDIVIEMLQNEEDAQRSQADCHEEARDVEQDFASYSINDHIWAECSNKIRQPDNNGWQVAIDTPSRFFKNRNSVKNDSVDSGEEPHRRTAH